MCTHATSRSESDESQPTGGWISIPRCSIARAPLALFDANVLSFWPEHRDHGAMRPSVREALRDEGLVAATLASLLRRSRLTSDLDLLTQEGQVLALDDADDTEEIVILAAAIRDGELPPIAAVAADSTGTPAEWMAFPSLTTPYAVGFGPSTVPAMPPPGASR